MKKLKSLDSIQVFVAKKFHKADSLFFRPRKRIIIVLPLEHQTVVNVRSFQKAYFLKEVCLLPFPPEGTSKFSIFSIFFFSSRMLLAPSAL